MKCLSWNVNGYRAVLKKGFGDWFEGLDADCVCLQETKAAPEQVSADEAEPPGYSGHWNASTVKKGYSGVATFCRRAPIRVATGIDDERFAGEGRCLLTEFEAFHLLNVYFPNGQMSQERLDFKMGYYEAFLAYAQKLRETKPVVVCGDFNTAHTEIDIARPKENEKTSGFLPMERAWLDRFMAHGYLDAFRRLHPDEPDHYTWWSWRARARERNVGWRIDYFFVSEELADKVAAAWIEPHVMGSDHCPVGLELDL